KTPFSPAVVAPFVKAAQGVVAGQQTSAPMSASRGRQCNAWTIQQLREEAANKRNKRDEPPSSPRARRQHSRTPRNGSRRGKRAPPDLRCGLRRQFLGEFVDH